MLDILALCTEMNVANIQACEIDNANAAKIPSNVVLLSSRNRFNGLIDLLLFIYSFGTTSYARLWTDFILST